MQTTIPLKMPQDLVTRLKKTFKIRGMSMSDLIRQNLQNTYASDTVKEKEPEIFKYFGKFPDDQGIREFERDLEESKKGYRIREIEF